MLFPMPSWNTFGHSFLSYTADSQTNKQTDGLERHTWPVKVVFVSAYLLLRLASVVAARGGSWGSSTSSLGI